MTPVREPYLFDGHNDLARRILEGEDPGVRTEGGHLDVPRMREGGMDGGVFAVWVDPRASSDPLERTLRGVGRLRGWLEERPGIRPILTGRDLERAEEAGEVAAVIGVEGGYGVRSDDLAAVDRLFEAGVRCLTLTWMEPTEWADAAGRPPVHGGLSPFGRRVVERLVELGAAADVSHASDRAAEDALAAGGGGVTASHSGVRALVDHPRNIPDGLLEALSAAGGVAGVNFFPGYLDARTALVYEEVRERLGDEVFSEGGTRALEGALPRGGEGVGLEAVAAHVEHAVRVAGPGAVGFGSDFDGVPLLPRGMRDVRDLPRLLELLRERGMEEETLRRVAGGNFRRFFRSLLP